VKPERRVAIGVTGHRRCAHVTRIRAGIREAFTAIERAFGVRRFAVISALAEGADRLVAHEALSRGDAGLIVPLPFAVADYLADFATEESRQEFLGLLDRASEVIHPRNERERGYAAAGRSVLDRCDVLVAVWDGREAGGPGGTGEIVAAARGCGRPLAWIHADTGQVVYERFDVR
jgi:hypothetical protein